MLNKIILASKSKVRKEILDKNNIISEVEPSNVDEDIIKKSLIKEKASPKAISKNLAELKANKVSKKKNENLVLGADSVIDLNGELISKPKDRKEALEISNLREEEFDEILRLVLLIDELIEREVSKRGLIHVDGKKEFAEEGLKEYLSKISDEALYAYNVYQIEGEGKNLFSSIQGDQDTIMGLPIQKIKEYLNNYK